MDCYTKWIRGYTLTEAEENELEAYLNGYFKSIKVKDDDGKPLKDILE